MLNLKKKTFFQICFCFFLKYLTLYSKNSYDHFKNIFLLKTRELIDHLMKSTKKLQALVYVFFIYTFDMGELPIFFTRGLSFSLCLSFFFSLKQNLPPF